MSWSSPRIASRRDAIPQLLSLFLTPINSLTEALIFTSFTKHLLVKSVNNEENSRFIREEARLATPPCSPFQRVLDSANSISILPIDHTSLFVMAIRDSSPSLSEESFNGDGKPKQPSFTTPVVVRNRFVGRTFYSFIPPDIWLLHVHSHACECIPMLLGKSTQSRAIHSLSSSARVSWLFAWI